MRQVQIISKGDEARAKLMKGADYLAECVKLTLGPYGLNWALPNLKKPSTNDGMTVASEIRLEDEVENEGAKKMYKIAQNIADLAEDATTSGVTIAQAILKEASKQLGNRDKGIIAKMSPPELKEKIMNEYTEVASKLDGMAQLITTKEQLIECAMVSVENKELAEMIGSMQWELGPDGIILPEVSNKPETTIERVSGYRVENSFATSLIINNQEKLALELDDVGVIATNHNITSTKDLVPLFESLQKTKTKRVILIGRMFSLEAIQECMQNINAGGLQVYPINAPHGNQVEVLKDIASVTNAVACLDEERALEDIQVSDVGFAKRIVADKNSATFVADKTERVDKRLEDLENKLKASQSSAYDKAKLEGRIAQMKGGFAIMKIGSLSEGEKSYRKDKVDDCVGAVRRALKGGVVAGGGVALNTIADTLPDDYILKTPLRSVHKWIVESAPADFVIEEWVKDPVIVLKTALEQACIGIADLVTNGGVAVFEHEKPKCCAQQ